MACRPEGGEDSALFAPVGLWRLIRCPFDLIILFDTAERHVLALIVAGHVLGSFARQDAGELANPELSALPLIGSTDQCMDSSDLAESTEAMAALARLYSLTSTTLALLALRFLRRSSHSEGIAGVEAFRRDRGWLA